jgi:hypothetical protein
MQNNGLLMKWSGQEATNDSWEPYSELRDKEKLIEYLRDNRMTSLINKKHKV